MALEASEDEIKQAIGIIHRVDDSQHLDQLWHAMKARRELLNKQQVWNLRVGMRVSWTGKHGRQHGVITKIKQKWVEVDADPCPPHSNVPTKWNVVAGILVPESSQKP